MKICMVTYSFYENDNRVRRYAESLTSRGDHVDVLSLRAPYLEKSGIMNGVNIFRIQRRIRDERFKISYLLKLIAFFVRSSIFLALMHLKHQYDVVHVHSVPDFEVFAAWLPKLTGAKIILDIHDLVPEFYLSKFKATPGSLLFKMLLFIEKLSTSFADHVIIANHLWFEKLTERSVIRNKCTPMINYPDPKIFYQRNRRRRDGKFIITYPGTLNRHQGVDLVLRALNIIKENAPDVEFHIYGEGPEKHALQELADSLELDGMVRFTRCVPIDEIADVMAKSDLGVVAKRKDTFGNEAFSTKTLEFMLQGIPVLVSDTRIDRYYFDDSMVKFFQSGSAQDLAENILALKNDKNLRKSIARNALKFAKENDWNVMKNVYLRLVNDLVNGETSHCILREHE